MDWVAKGIAKRFDDIEAVSDLKFSLKKGSVIALLGRNGAGKSTTIRILASLIKADTGSFTFEGVDLLKETRRLRSLMGYVSQELALDKALTATEFMKFQAGIYHLKWKTVADQAIELLRAVNLFDDKDRRVQGYSGGMKRRLDLAAAMLNKPKLLILDEPTTGLDVEGREQIWQLIHQYRADGGSVILASHDFREVEELANEVLIMNKGVTAVQGPLENLQRDLGDYVVKAKLDDSSTNDHHQQIQSVLTDLDGLNRVMEIEDGTHFTLRSSASLHQTQDMVASAFDRKELKLMSMSMQIPILEDVYRFAVGGSL